MTTPFDTAYWEDEYQEWLDKHDLFTRRAELLLFVLIFIIGFCVGKTS